jgi:hypothetical protein
MLNLIANDIMSGVSQFRFSNDGVWDSEAWESAAASKAWTLTSGDGLKIVYFQIKDNAGLLSLTYSDNINLEIPTPAPTSTPASTSTFTSSSTASPTPNPTPTLTPRATEISNPATSSPIPSQIPSSFPSPLSQPTETSLYLYAAAVLVIAVISSATLRIAKRH